MLVLGWVGWSWVGLGWGWIGVRQHMDAWAGGGGRVVVGRSTDDAANATGFVGVGGWVGARQHIGWVDGWWWRVVMVVVGG